MSKDKYKSFKDFIGILIGLEFAVVVLLISSSMQEESRMSLWPLATIVWLILSILFGLECMMGFLGYELKVQENEENKRDLFEKKGRLFWYATMYSFYMGLIALLCSTEFVPLALIVYYTLWINITCFWTRHVYKDISNAVWKYIISVIIAVFFIAYPWYLGVFLYEKIPFEILHVHHIISIIITAINSLFIVAAFYKQLREWKPNIFNYP